VRERSGKAPRVEIMIPLVAYERELELARSRVLAVAEQEGFFYGDPRQAPDGVTALRDDMRIDAP
jgi:hypothetical protein